MYLGFPLCRRRSTTCAAWRRAIVKMNSVSTSCVTEPMVLSAVARGGQRRAGAIGEVTVGAALPSRPAAVRASAGRDQHPSHLWRQPHAGGRSARGA